MPSDARDWRREFFDEKYRDEEDPWHFFDSEYEQTKYQRQTDAIEDRLPDPASILEIGCAEGAHTEMLLGTFESANVLGIDVSPVAIERARENVDDPRAEFKVADVVEFFDGEVNTFDVIAWSESIYYVGGRLSVAETNDLVEEVCEHLNPGGLLCSANIVDQPTGPEASLTRRPVQEAYHTMFAAAVEPVHRATYTEYKPESDREYTYEIWLFEREAGERSG